MEPRGFRPIALMSSISGTTVLVETRVVSGGGGQGARVGAGMEKKLARVECCSPPYLCPASYEQKQFGTPITTP